jgi:arylesterase/paraoxonase
VYDRYIAASGLLANRPGKLQAVNNLKSYEIKFADSIRNCEDVILEEDRGVAILSCDPGRDRWNTVMVSAWLLEGQR